MPKIDVSHETYEKIKDQLSEPSPSLNNIDEMMGQKFFIRTVTYHMVGKLTHKVVDEDTILWCFSGASWVADSGRFMEAIKNGTLNEVEPVGTMLLNPDSIVDMFPWIHPLPTDQK